MFYQLTIYSHVVTGKNFFNEDIEVIAKTVVSIDLTLPTIAEIHRIAKELTGDNFTNLDVIRLSDKKTVVTHVLHPDMRVELITSRDELIWAARKEPLKLCGLNGKEAEVIPDDLLPIPDYIDV